MLRFRIAVVDLRRQIRLEISTIDTCKPTVMKFIKCMNFSYTVLSTDRILAAFRHQRTPKGMSVISRSCALFLVPGSALLVPERRNCGPPFAVAGPLESLSLFCLRARKY